MVRYILLLPLCLLLQDQPNASEETAGSDEPGAVAVIQAQVHLKNEDLLRQDLLAGLAILSPQAFPGSLPWGAMQQIQGRIASGSPLWRSVSWRQIHQK